MNAKKASLSRPQQSSKKDDRRLDFLNRLKTGTASSAAVPAADLEQIPAVPETPVPPAKLRGSGRVSLRGKLPATPKEDEKSVLLRLPAGLLEAFDAHTVGTRTAVIIALMADATARAQAGENLDFEAEDVTKFLS